MIDVASTSFIFVIEELESETKKMMQPSIDINKLSYEIFSILESKFLFGYDDAKLFDTGNLPETPTKSIPEPHNAGKVRILSIDAGSGILAAVVLARLEALLAEQCRDSDARIADFFDLAAGSGAGGVLIAMLFTRAPDGRPLFSAGEALRFISKNHKKFPSAGRKGVFRRSGGLFRRIFGDSNLRDTIKPVLVPCYDLATGAPFMFSRADAVESDAFDFSIRDVCTATCSEKAAVRLLSVNGQTMIRAVSGSIAMRNPTATAITHVLNNKREFPLSFGIEDLLIFSLGGGDWPATDLVKIASESAAEMVDQAVAMAFEQSGVRSTNYVRIQANLRVRKGLSPPSLAKAAAAVPVEEEIFKQRSVDSVMFLGRNISDRTNGERLEWLCGELIAEHDRKKGRSTPRMSSATNSTMLTITAASTLPSAESL